MKKLTCDNYCHLYLVRHGQTDWNLKRMIQGHTDIPLNKTGEKQAEELAQNLREIKFAASFSSDLLRAKRTAEIIAQEKKIAVQTTKALRERYSGVFQGRNWEKDKEYRQAIDKWAAMSSKERRKHNISFAAEDNDELMRRFIPFLREIAVAYSGKNVLVVTHAGPIRIFLTKILEKVLPHGSINNTAYIRIDSDGVDFFLKETYGIKKELPH